MSAHTPSAGFLGSTFALAGRQKEREVWAKFHDGGGAGSAGSVSRAEAKELTERVAYLEREAGALARERAVLLEELAVAGQLRGDWEEALRVAEAKVLRERAEHAAVTEALQSRLGGALAEAEVQRRACSEAQRQAEAAQAGAAGAVGSVRRELEERCLQAEAARAAAEAASRTVTVERDRALAAAATHKADKEAAENALRSVSDNVTAREQLAEARAADAAQTIAEAGAKCAAAAAESAAAAADAAATAALQTAAQQAWSDARRTEEQWRARCSQLEAERTQTSPDGTTVAVHAELVLPVCAPPIATDHVLHGAHAPHNTLLSQTAPSLDAAAADQRASAPLQTAGLVTRALRLLPGFGPRDSRARKPAAAAAIPTAAAVASASQEAAVVAGVTGQQLGAADRSTLDAHGDAVVAGEQERGSLGARSHGRSVANFSNKRPPPSVPAAAPSFQQSQRRSLRSSASPSPEKSGVASRGAKALAPVKRKRGATSDDTGPAKSGDGPRRSARQNSDKKVTTSVDAATSSLDKARRSARV